MLDRQRDIARVVLASWTIDLARQEGRTLRDDLGRRDFSANAIALPLAPGAGLLDPTGGLAALRQGRLVAVSEANLLDDPLRLLRGIRLCWQLELQLETTTAGWIATHASRLADVAGERVLSELQRLAEAAEGGRGLLQALELDLLRPWTTEGGTTQGGATEGWAAGWLALLDAGATGRLGLSAAESAAALPLARLAALLPPQAVLALRGSRRLQRQCAVLRHWWQRLQDSGGATAAGERRPLPLDALDETARLQLQHELEPILPALLLALPAAPARLALQRWRDAEDPLFHPRSALNGDRLRQELGMPAGPELGELLGHLSHERAFGRLPAGGTQEALAAARLWLEQRR